MKRLDTNQKGFTILELLITTMVFSVIFLGVTTALIQISKLYYKGVVTGRTQETTRGIMDRIAQQLQFGNEDVAQALDKDYIVTGAPSSRLTFKAFCIGGTRYSYLLNAQVNKDIPAGSYEQSTNRLRHALWRDSVPSGGNCEPANLSLDQPSTGQNGEDMLGANTRLSKFSASCTAANICTVTVGIIYGENDLIEFNPAGEPFRCRTIIGNQWCATSQFTTSVLKRVGG